jgi:hypothetical protein
MPMLFVRCRACRTEFASGIAPVSGIPGGVALFNVLEKCPSCGEIGAYNTHEFHFAGPVPADDVPGGVSVPPSNTEALERSYEDHSQTPSADAPTGEPPARTSANPRP